MFQVSVEETFSAGHALRGYRGKCENVHGHNYRVRVTLEGPQLDAIGLLVDFTHLKQVIREIMGRLDHQFMNDLEPFKAVNPSAENVAKYFYEEVTRQLKGLPQGARVTDVVSVFHYRDSGAAGGGGLHCCAALRGNCARISAADCGNDSFLWHDLLVVAPVGAQSEFPPGIDRKGLGRTQREKRPPAPGGAVVNCRAPKYGYHGNFQIDPGRGHTRRPAMHFRAADGLQSALHLVRYRVRLSWREEDERRGSYGARG